MTKFLGIDHPLILVRDLAAARQRYESIGFTMTPPGKHPWGTSTSVAIMDDCLVELMSIYDEGLLDEKPAGPFRFGRYIQAHLAEREGASLCALHSDDAVADAAQVAERGVVCQGTIDFGRDVVLPDGSKDRTATTLKVLQDDSLPRISNFICHQHRPDLIYIPKWRQHANGASGYTQVSILAAAADQPAVRRRLEGLYGPQAVSDIPGGFAARTGQGSFAIYDRAEFERRYAPLPAELAQAATPIYAALHIKVDNLSTVERILRAADVAFRREEHRILLTDATAFGNVFLNFTDRTNLT